MKSYFAGTVEAAIRTARQELGEEAMLMNSRKTTVEARHLGAYEVVFAVSSDRAAATVPAPSTLTQPAATPAPAPSSIAGEVAEIRRQLARMSAAVARTNERAASHAP
ncbi:MAG: hypothetical protein ABIZ80_02335, partial [Bryobacteraceae bacterium]